MSGAPSNAFKPNCIATPGTAGDDDPVPGPGLNVAEDPYPGTFLLLARASTPEQSAFVGNQAGGRVFLFLQTDDFWRDYNRLVAAGVEFIRPPRDEPYGTVAVFQDIYGNRWDLLQ